MWPNPQETADLITFIENILNGKLHFLCIETPLGYFYCMKVGVKVFPKCFTVSKNIRKTSSGLPKSFWGNIKCHEKILIYMFFILGSGTNVSKYSRMDQVKFFKRCLPQILLGPFLNILTHIPLLVMNSIITDSWILCSKCNVVKIYVTLQLFILIIVINIKIKMCIVLKID